MTNLAVVVDCKALVKLQQTFPEPWKMPFHHSSFQNQPEVNSVVSVFLLPLSLSDRQNYNLSSYLILACDIMNISYIKYNEISFPFSFSTLTKKH